jgi:hypothetical protein
MKIAAAFQMGVSGGAAGGCVRGIINEASSVQLPTLSLCGGSFGDNRTADIVPSPWWAEISA